MPALQLPPPTSVRDGGRARRWVAISGAITVSLTLGLGTWAHQLPEPKRASFLLSHQIIRIAAAVGTTVSVALLLLLTLPLMLNWLERRGFVGFVAARHVRSGKSGFLTVISLLSILAVLISSFALCIVVSIMGGFGVDLKTKILGNNAHVTVDRLLVRRSAHKTDPSSLLGTGDPGGDPDPKASSPTSRTRSWDDLLDEVRLVAGVAAATPVVTGEVMASSTSNTAGVMLRGVEVQSIGSVIDLVKNIEVGRFEYLSDPDKISEMGEDEPIWVGRGGDQYLRGPRAHRRSASDGESDLDKDVLAVLRAKETQPGIVLGRELAKMLRVYVGDVITLVSPIGDLSPMGILPRARRFQVAAVFYSGMYEYDSSHAYVTLETAQKFLDQPGEVNQFDVRIEQEEESQLVASRIEKALEAQEVRVRDWKQMNQGLFSALELEKIVIFIVLSIAIVVGSFCIVCTLLLMVTEKSKEIAILKASGASNLDILRIFMGEGLLIGGIGTLFGVVMGLTLCISLPWYGMRLDPDVYYVDRLPINVDPVDYALVAVCSLGITILATIYPALAASRLRPVDGIRYE